MNQVNNGVCSGCGRGVGDWHKGDCPKRKDKIQGVSPADVQRTKTEPDNFEGHVGRECGEHRTTGSRAWCFGCQEWCYPNLPCRGCELPQLRSAIQEIGATATGPWADANEALEIIRRICHRVTP